MVSVERQPSLYRVWISRGLPDPSRDTPFRDIETQLEQFGVNAGRSPGLILSHHTDDQGANLFADTLPSSYLSDSETHVQYKRNPARCQFTTVLVDCNS